MKLEPRNKKPTQMIVAKPDPIGLSISDLELLAESSGMLHDTTPTGLIRQLKNLVLLSPAQRDMRRKLCEAVLREAERIQEVALREKAELTRLVIEIRYQLESDQLRIDHRHVMTELSQVAEDQFAADLNALFADKKRQLQSLAVQGGDPELKQLTRACIDAMTLAGANELLERNSSREEAES
jgi:hypothetical protein